MICALQNGSYGSRLISTDYTDEENARMVDATMSLSSTRNNLYRCSVDRYERIHHTYLDIMSEISKRMDAKDFPETSRPIYQDSMRSLQEAMRVRWGSLVSDLCTMEQINSGFIDSMYACSTNALSEQLEIASRLRLYPIVVHPLVRQDAMTLQGQGASTPPRSLKRSRSSSPDSAGSVQENESEDEVAPCSEAADGATGPRGGERAALSRRL